LKNDLPKFPTDFQEKIKRYRRWQDAQLSLMGRILLFRGILEIFNKDFQNKEIRYTKYNKPFFNDNSIHFNISHSGEIVICAITDQSEIGIDIEMISNIEIEDLKSQFTENEWNRIMNSNNKQEAFFEYWAQKEAVIKSHGDGLIIPLKSFEISENEAVINHEKFFLQEIKIDDQYKCYLSLKECFNEISIKQIQINQ
jgi:4'-phosphopantetheinyl transferase